VPALHDKVFALGGYIKKSKQRILKLPLAMKSREWFTGLWMNINAKHHALSNSKTILG
jgi:hypothetical protein